MGGRNEQAHNRQKRRIAAMTMRRHVQSATPYPGLTAINL
jgi:hypothetical protein